MYVNLQLSKSFRYFNTEVPAEETNKDKSMDTSEDLLDTDNRSPEVVEATQRLSQSEGPLFSVQQGLASVRPGTAINSLAEVDAISSAAGDCTSQAINSIVEMSANSVGSVNNDESSSVTTKSAGDILSIAAGSDITVPTLTESGNMTFTIDGKTVELTISDIDDEATGDRGQKSSSERLTCTGELTIVDDSNCLSGENSETITKEVFLCGQCNVGFGTMEDCKAHMIKDHDIPEESDAEYDIEGKVSIGTQVEGPKGKKRGRKRKTEVLKEESEDEEEVKKL